MCQNTTSCAKAKGWNPDLRLLYPEYLNCERNFLNFPALQATFIVRRSLLFGVETSDLRPRNPGNIFNSVFTVNQASAKTGNSYKVNLTYAPRTTPGLRPTVIEYHRSSGRTAAKKYVAGS